MKMNFIKKYAITRMLRYASHQSDENICFINNNHNFSYVQRTRKERKENR